MMRVRRKCGPLFLAAFAGCCTSTPPPERSRSVVVEEFAKVAQVDFKDGTNATLLDDLQTCAEAGGIVRVSLDMRLWSRLKGVESMHLKGKLGMDTALSAMAHYTAGEFEVTYTSEGVLLAAR